jgi:hypothetical protein
VGTQAKAAGGLAAWDFNLRRGVLSNNARDNPVAFPVRALAFAKLQQMTSMKIEESRLDRGGTSQPPQEAREPEDELPFDGRSCVIVGSDCQFERQIILRVLKRADDGLCR